MERSGGDMWEFSGAQPSLHTLQGHFLTCGADRIVTGCDRVCAIHRHRVGVMCRLGKTSVLWELWVRRCVLVCHHVLVGHCVLERPVQT